MRVALIIYGSIDTVTGGYVYNKQLVELLRAKGVVVKIFSQDNKNILRRLRNNFSNSLLKAITKFSPDILLQDELNFFSLFLFNSKLKKIKTFPIISIVHVLTSSLIQNKLLKVLIQQFETRYLRSVDGYIYNSISTKQTVEALIGKSQNYLIAYPGKDRLEIGKVTSNRMVNFYQQPLRIAFVGNLHRNKGLHALLKALADIDGRLWKLSIIGSADFKAKYTKQIKTLIKTLNITGNTIFYGVLSPEKLRTELTNHHVLAVPSYYESFGIVYVEAMGAGLPVIAGKYGGANEIVANNTGFLVTPEDVHTIRASLERLIFNRDLLRKMSAASLEAYDKFPSWRQSMNAVYQFLNTCINP